MRRRTATFTGPASTRSRSCATCCSPRNSRARRRRGVGLRAAPRGGRLRHLAAGPPAGAAAHHARMLTTEQGAMTSLYCATSPAVAATAAATTTSARCGSRTRSPPRSWRSCCGSAAATLDRGWLNLQASGPAWRGVTGWSYGPSGDAAGRADAGQAGGRDPARARLFEPKWDGFRSIVFRDGDEVEIGSRNERPMTRYFPELVAPLTAELPPRCVIDGEIVIPDSTAGGWTSRRCSSASTRRPAGCELLAEQTPASVRRVRPARARRRRLHRAAVHRAPGGARSRRWPAPAPPIHVTPATTDPETAAAVVQPVRGGRVWTG